jgi:hypothetical protein
MSKGYKAFCYIFMPLFVAGGVFLLYQAATSSNFAGALLFIFLGLACAFIGFYLVWEARVMLVTVDEHAVTQRTVFSTRSISLNELDGYRVGEKEAFSLVPREGKTLSLTKSIADRKDLIEWVKENYPDIDLREREAAEEEVLQDEKYGATKDEREMALSKARRMSGIGTLVGVGLGFLFVFYPKPFELILALLYLAPLVALFLIWQAKGLIRFYSRKNSPYPSIGLLAAFPVGAGALRALLGYHLYGFQQHAWLLLIPAAILLLLVSLAAARALLTGDQKRSGTITAILVFALLYSYGALIHTNCYFDGSPAQVWPVKVTHKRISHGKSTSYYVEVTPWGKYTDAKEVDVSESFYYTVENGDSIQAVLQPGKWGIPWYYLTR